MQEVIAYTTVYGNPSTRELFLRPIVSINLKESGCTMTKVVGEDGKVTCNLKWNNN